MFKHFVQLFMKFYLLVTKLLPKSNLSCQFHFGFCVCMSIMFVYETETFLGKKGQKKLKYFFKITFICLYDLKITHTVIEYFNVVLFQI